MELNIPDSAIPSTSANPMQPTGPTRGILDPEWGDETTNTAICTSVGDQQDLQMVPDGQGGAIIAWRDYRSGMSDDIYAQRVNASGAAQWAADGVAICLFKGSQTCPQLVADGHGGAIIVWQDYRVTYPDIYAQRVNASGAVQWATDGIAVCTALGQQYYPQLVADGQGGTIITWQDNRNFQWDIYAQRVSASGLALWAADGETVCSASESQFFPEMVPDGQGGAIITWYDFRSGTEVDIYAQRVDASGIVQWPPAGLAVSTAAGNQLKPQLVTDGKGGAIITWYDSRSGMDWDIYAQRVSGAGVAQWAANGAIVCTASGDQFNPRLVPDGQGGAIVAWEDFRGGIDWDIRAQRLNGSGARLWAANDTAVSTAAGDQFNPRLIPDGQGGGVIAWEDFSNGVDWDVRAQRVNMNGIPLWQRNGLGISIAPGDQRYSRLVIDSRWLSGNQQAQSPEQSDTANEFKGIIAAWQDGRNSTEAGTDIYAQAINEDGREFVERHALDPQWGNETANRALCTVPGNQRFSQLVPDGQGGAIIVWEDYRSGNWDIYAQRVSGTGAAIWIVNGVAVCTASGSQTYPQLVPDGRGGAIIVWHDYRSGNWDIYAQRVSETGAAQWTANGVAVCTASGEQSGQQLVPDGQGGAIIVWHDYRSDGTFDIYAQRVSGTGVPQWTANGVAVCTATDDQYGPQLAPDGQGGAIIVWEDYRNAYSDIYAQRVSGTGVAQWTANGVAVCTATDDQYGPQLVPDGQGGAVITWEDYRSGNWDIYAQRLSETSAAQWTANGVALCTAADDQADQQLVPDGKGGAIIVWEDYRSGNWDIYAQRVSETGLAQWTADGVAVCTATNDQYGPQLAPDGQGGAIIVWEDYRNAYTDIYAQRVSETGVARWTTDGVAVCAASGNQYPQQLVPDGQGGAIITWEDYRSSNYDIYAQRLSLTQSTVVVNEVMYDPLSGGEWVELFNPSHVAYNISGWTLVDNTGAAVFTVPEPSILSSGAYYLCNLSASSLDNDDWAALYDSDGTMRDYVCWGIAEPFGATYDRAVLAQHWAGGSGFYVDTSAHAPGQSIGRDMDSHDTNSKADWDIACGKDAEEPTPGEMNLDVPVFIPIHLGWNLISVPLEMPTSLVGDVLSPISGKWDVVKYYDTTDIGDPWKSYRVGGTANDLFTLDHRMGFWLHATENCTLPVFGNKPASTSITLHAGWNLVGYPSLTSTTPVGVALLGTGADMVGGYDANSPYVRELDSGYIMKPGEGYWVHVPADAVWTVDW